MKTKFGKKLLKENSAIMDTLNRELEDLARTLNNDNTDEFLDEFVEEVMDQIRHNREFYGSLQQQINDAITLETFLK